MSARRVASEIDGLRSGCAEPSLHRFEFADVRPDVEAGVFVVDKLTPERASMVALTVAQSATMEYYERIVDQMCGDTDHFVQRLQRSADISVITAKLQRFIGAAISTRSEVSSVLHWLDKPDVV